MPKDLSAFFYPKSIAVVGASRTPEKVGAIVLKNLVEGKYQGKIFPINPNTPSIGSLQCFKDISSLPEAPDLTLIAVPAPLVLEVLTQVGEKGIKNVVVFSAGFKEAGEEGKELEKNLSEIALKYQINLLGPNCLGFVNNLAPLNATFGQVSGQPGNLRFISQSGAIATGLFDWCKSVGLGFGEFLTLGNKAGLSENEFLEYFLTEVQPPLAPEYKEGLSNVTPIGLYLESISDGKQFLNITSQITKTNPIFIIKPGKTQAAKNAMQSHTGAIAGEDSVLDTALNQSGITRCQTLEDFFDLSRAFAWENAPLGPKVAIISNAGGPAVVSADAISGEGLELAALDDQVKNQLLQILPRAASVLNPIDVLGDALADRFAKAAEIIFQGSYADALVVILTPQVMTEIEKTAQALGELSKKYQKPIFCSFIGGSLVAEGEKVLNSYKIPSFRFPERAISAIGAMWRFKKHQIEQSSPIPTAPLTLNMEKTQAIITQAKTNNQKTLDNLQANQIISEIGIKTPATENVSDNIQAENFAHQYGFPVVLKLSAAGLLHKKKVGGVVLDIRNEEALERAFNTLQRKILELEPKLKEIAKIQIQKDVASGVEVIVGVKTDPTFGKVLLFGAGGSLAELIADKNLHLLPISLASSQALVKKSKIYSVLKGSEDEPSFALDKLYDLIVRLGVLAENTPQVSDIEINPVIITQNDVWAVDSKVILEHEEKIINAPQFKTAKVINNEVLASKYHYLEIETEIPFIFQAGQYVSIKVAEERLNCYSIASHSTPNRFNLLIDTSPSGPGSKFFEHLKIGDKISFLGPFGAFTLKPEDGARQLLFLGTGSGVAPLRCMIESALREKKCQLPITLYLGLSYPEDLFWQDYFQKLSLDYPNFKCKIAIWKADNNWQGPRGFITDLVKQDILDATGTAAYLCGNKQMMVDTSSLLLQRGCKQDKIYSEKF